MANISVLNTDAQLSGKTLAVLENDNVFSGANEFSGDFELSGFVAFTGTVYEGTGVGSLGIPFDHPNGALANGGRSGIMAVQPVGLGATAQPVSIVSDGIPIGEFGLDLDQDPFIVIPSRAAGTGAHRGGLLSVGRNTSGSGAPSLIGLQTRGGTQYYLWVDDNGKLEIGTAYPQEDGTPAHNSGTIVGTQS